MTTSSELQAAFGYLTEAELAGLKQLAQMLPDNPVVMNIGSGSGTSSLAFMESRDDLLLLCVDIQYEDNPFGSLFAERQALEQSGYSGRFLQTCRDSKELGKEWKTPAYTTPGYINLLDMIFIDGNHSYPGAKGDILAWLPNIKPGGIIAVHDFDKKRVYASGQLSGKVMHPLPWPGVDRAVRKFLCPYFEIVLHIDTLISFWVTEEGMRRLNETNPNGF